MTLRTEFVKHIPEDLEEGVLYVSEEYRVAIHRCACGCGLQVVTPTHGNGWQIKAEGDLVTLTPSIGNWQFACRSHYWITNNEVVWA